MPKIDRERLARVVRHLRECRPLPDRVEGLPPRLRDEFRAAARNEFPTPAPMPEHDSANTVWLPRLAAAAFSALVIAVLASRHPGRLLPHGAVSSGSNASGSSAAPAVLATLDGLPLEVGTPIVAEDVPRLVDHPGRARWTLGPRSLGRLLPESEGMLRVELERGTLAADVHPGSARPTFAVLAQGTLVLVHGTHFQVSLEGDLARVSVSTGEVQVRPLGEMGGVLLRAGSLQRFRAGLPVPELDPALDAKSEPGGAAPPVDHAARIPARSAASTARHRPSASAGGAGRPAARPGTVVPSTNISSAPDADRALEIVSARVQDCFQRHTERPSGLGIELSTTLGLWVQPDGELLRADFDPPLAPAVEHCVAAELGHLHVTPTPEGYRVERALLLRR